MKVEYILPILASAPSPLKTLFAIWMILTIIVGGWVLKIYITQNIRKFSLEQQKPNIEIQREISDYSVYLKDIISQHKKSINEVANKMNYTGSYSSGSHLKAQYELVKEKQNKILGQWERVKRKIEDILINYNKTCIEDKNVQKKFDTLEQNKDRVIKEVMDITDEYFSKRSGTFDKQTIESVKKDIFNN